MKDNNYLIGVDCGASFAKVSVFSNSKLIFEIKRMPSFSTESISSSNQVIVFDNLVEKLAKFNNAIWVFAVAGLDNEFEKNRFAKWAKLNLTSLGIVLKSLAVVNDTELVLAAGGSGFGVSLVAGTGSNCIGVNRQGKKEKCGGYGKELSDQGSGYALGLAGLKIFTKMIDGRKRKTGFVKEVLKLYKVKSIIELKEKLAKEENQKKLVAKLAKIVIKEARSGSYDFKEIVDLEVYELVGMVYGVMKKLNDVDLPLYLYGSLFKNSYFLKRFESLLHRIMPGVDPDLIDVRMGFLKLGN